MVVRPVGPIVLPQLKRQASGQKFVQHHARGCRDRCGVDGALGAGVCSGDIYAGVPPETASRVWVMASERLLERPKLPRRQVPS